MKHSLTLFLILLYLGSFSQNDRSNMLKYWRYKDRLQYFVIPGYKQGESHVSSERNNKDSLKNISFGQQGIYWGYYVGTLATEYKLLINSNNSTQAEKTKLEINQALIQFIRYMDPCEHYWGYNDEFNGFFCRENIPCGFFDENSPEGYTASNESHKSALNKGLSSENVWSESEGSMRGLPKGHPGWVDKISIGNCPPIIGGTKEALSIDEATGVLMGVALVYKCMQGSDEATLAKAIAYQIINYIKDSNGGINDWWIRYPNGDYIPDNFGGNGLCYAYPLSKTAEFFGFDFMNFWNDVTIYPQELIWQGLQELPNHSAEYNNAMSLILAAISDSWRQVIIVNSTPVVTPINTTGSGIVTVSRLYDWQPFYLLLWAVLNDKTGNEKVEDHLNSAFEKLNTAPCEGTYFYNAENCSNNGWAYSYRWRATLDEQNGLKTNQNQGIFNGLDYMLFYNLFSLYKGDALSGYWSYSERAVSGEFPRPTSFINQETCISSWGSDYSPLRVFSYNKIESTIILHNHLESDENISCTGNMLYLAESNILLNPGFKVEEGSNFYASVENFSCAEFMSTNRISAPTEEVIETTNTMPEQNQKFKVYPNPANGQLTIEYTTLQECRPVITLNDVYGKIVLQTDLYGGKQTIDISTLPAGVYLFKFVCGEQTEVRKVIKQ